MACLLLSFGLLATAVSRATPQAEAGAVTPEQQRALATVAKLPVGAFVAMSHLVYVEPKELRALLASAELPAEPARRQAVSEFRQFAPGFTLVPAAEHAAIAEFGAFLESPTPRAALFRGTVEGTVTYVLAFRGTTILKDWLVNAAGFAGVVPPYHRDADALTGAVARRIEPGAILVLAGHSLGGGIAEYAASRHGLVALTFNSAHLSLPFDPDPRGLVHTFHVTGRHSWARLLFGDVVNGLRLGGNFEQTRVTAVPVGEGLVLRPHTIGTFYAWQPRKEPRGLARLGPEAKLRRSALLRSMPNLVAETPALLRDAIRVFDVTHCPAFADAPDDELADVWDLRLRYGIVWDTHPSGGLPVENLRIFDPAENEPTEGDYAETWASQTSFSHPFTRTTALLLNLGRRMLNYDQATQHNFSTTEFGAGVGLSLLDGRGTLALAAIYQRFASSAGNAGDAIGAQVSGSFMLENFMFWEDLSYSWIENTRLPGADGYLSDVNAGVRAFLWRHRAAASLSHVAVQIRGFHGKRAAGDKQLDNLQWGLGVGLVARYKQVRFFIERGRRWTDHDIVAPRPAEFFDRETILRLELGYETAFGDQWRVLGWELTAAHALVHNRTRAGVGDYDRKLTSLQVSKQF
ncbi:MAG TPA: hypothetical protein VGE76_00400 [Opitutaceae bacterium]